MKLNCKKTCKVQGPHSSITEDSSFLACYTMSLDKQSQHELLTLKTGIMILQTIRNYLPNDSVTSQKISTCCMQTSLTTLNFNKRDKTSSELN
jgi:hypothetical protein